MAEGHTCMAWIASESAPPRLAPALLHAAMTGSPV